MKRLICLASALFAILFLSVPVFPHAIKITPARVNLKVNGHAIMAEFRTDCVMWQEASGIPMEKLSSEWSKETSASIAGYLYANFTISVAGERLAGEILRHDYWEKMFSMERRSYLSIVVYYGLPDISGDARVESRLFFELDEFPGHDAEKLVTVVDFSGRKDPVILKMASPSVEFDLVSSRRTLQEDALYAFGSGYARLFRDPIYLIFSITLLMMPIGIMNLRLIALFLAGYLAGTLYIVLQMDDPSGQLITALLSAGVVYNGLGNNLFMRKRFRLLTVPVFGVIAGLDMPGLLMQMGMGKGRLLLSGLSVTAGVLISQLCILLFLQALSYWRRARLGRWSRGFAEQRWRKELAIMSYGLVIAGLVFFITVFNKG